MLRDLDSSVSISTITGFCFLLLCAAWIFVLLFTLWYVLPFARLNQVEEATERQMIPLMNVNGSGDQGQPQEQRRSNSGPDNDSNLTDFVEHQVQPSDV